MEIGLNCALDVGVGRLAATWAVIDDLPERFHDDGARGHALGWRGSGRSLGAADGCPIGRSSHHPPAARCR